MAKYDPFNDLPHPDRTIVYSRAYGEHTRARRGTKSKVEINAVLKTHSLLLSGANIPARLVKNEIDIYRDGFPSGQLWQFLVGMFKKQLKMQLPLNVDELMLKDIARDYALSRLLKRGLSKNIVMSRSTVEVTMKNLNPEFRRKAIDGYQVEVAAMYFDFNAMESTSDSSVSPILPLNHGGVISFELNKGKLGDRFLISLKIIGCCAGIVQSDNAAMAMQIVSTGIIA